MKLSNRVRIILTSLFFLFLSIACSLGSINGQKTVNIQATVDAAVAGTVQAKAEIETRIAKGVEATLTAVAPTNTPLAKANQDVIIIKDTYLVDSKVDQYKSVGNIIGDVIGNFEMHGSIKIRDVYRSNGTSWAGVLIRADTPTAQHGKTRGYLFFIRENGAAGIHASISGHVNEERNIGLSGRNENRFKIVANNSRLELYINDQLMVSADKGYHDIGYLVLNVGGAKAEFTLDRIIKY